MKIIKTKKTGIGFAKLTLGGVSGTVDSTDFTVVP